MTQATLIQMTPDDVKELVESAVKRALSGRRPAIATLPDAARYLGVSEGTLKRQWKAWGLKKAYPGMSKVLFRYDELDGWIERGGSD